LTEERGHFSWWWWCCLFLGKRARQRVGVLRISSICWGIFVQKE
jgi:hypothetical protein